MRSSSATEGLYSNIPNAVNEACNNFVMSIISKVELDISQQTISFSKDNIKFLEGMDLSDFVNRAGYVMSEPIEFSRYEYILYFPLDLFQINGELITKEMNIDIALVDVEGNGSQASGTTYFYRCEDFDSDFNASDCRWPNQIEQTMQHGGNDCRCF